MIWHIFKKDWKLLWPLVLVVAVGQMIITALEIMLGHFSEPRELAQIAKYLPEAVWIGRVMLIVALVHQDKVPGDQQDWLVRPIRAFDMILAKLAFLLIAIHGPIVLTNIIAGSVQRLPIGDVLEATLVSNTTMLLLLSLPCFGAATITRTASEFIGGALAIVILIVGSNVIGDSVALPNPFASGMSWMQVVFPLLLALIAATIVIPLQYFRRATQQSRGVAVGAVLLMIMFSFTPWPQAFALQQWLAPDQAAAKPIAIAFDPALGISPGKSAITSGNTVQLPLRVTGLGADSFVMKDRAEVRIVDNRGITLYRGSTVLTQPNGKFDTDLSVRSEHGRDVDTYQQIALPVRILDLVGNRPVRVEIEYFLTLFHIEAAETIAAVNGNERTPGFGWCKSKIDGEDDDIELGCLKAGTQASCISAILENRLTGMRNSADEACARDYSPTYFYLSAIDKFRYEVAFRDPQGLAKYPVDGSQLADAQVIVKSYRPVAHFTRHLVIPQIRLNDWKPASAVTTAASPG